jgi:N-acetylglucosamine-6-phosphate deacetylase
MTSFVPSMTETSPRWIDIQVNGYGGVDFNAADLTVSAVRRACDHLRADGVRAILATIITDTLPSMTAQLRCLVEARRADPFVAEVIAGFHIEGPFINPSDGYRGAHALAPVCPADVDQALQLLEAGDGFVRLFTLAPECDPNLATTRRLVRERVVVSAGHTDATLDQLRAAIDAGLTHFTHLGNGCPMLMNRHDNIIQRVLSLADRLMIGFIGDGVHIPLPALGNYLRLTDPNHAYVTTDGMAAAGLGPGRYTIGGMTVEVDASGATWAPDRSHLMGSGVTFRQCVENIRRCVNWPATDLIRLTETNPGRVLRQG